MHIISVKLCKAAIIISYKFTLSGAAGLITELRERKTTTVSLKSQRTTS